jgi:halocyanin-like protein
VTFETMSDKFTARSETTRRTFLRGAVGAGVAASTGFAGAAAAQDGGPDYGGWFTSDAPGGAVDNYQGTVDFTGQDQVEVIVGADGNGGTFAFEPAAMRIDPGTTVTFSWVSNTHNVIVEEQPSGAGWAGHEPIENEGFSFEHTFETEGIYKYYCQPHLSLGMKGAVVVGGSGGISPEEAGLAGGDGGDGGGDEGGAAGGGEGEAAGPNVQPLESQGGVMAMVIAGIVAFLSPIAFALLVLLRGEDDERPTGQEEVEYRPGAEHR